MLKWKMLICLDLKHLYSLVAIQIVMLKQLIIYKNLKGILAWLMLILHDRLWLKSLSRVMSWFSFWRANLINMRSSLVKSKLSMNICRESFVICKISLPLAAKSTRKLLWSLLTILKTCLLDNLIWSLLLEQTCTWTWTKLKKHHLSSLSAKIKLL